MVIQAYITLPNTILLPDTVLINLALNQSIISSSKIFQRSSLIIN